MERRSRRLLAPLALFLFLWLSWRGISPFSALLDNSPDLTKYDVLIVGAGLSGAVLAERHASVLGHRVLVVEKRAHIGGMCYDYIDPETGLLMNKYGAHVFHTDSPVVWEYVNQFSAWWRWDHTVMAFVDGVYVPVPVNINTVNALFGYNITTSEEMASWLASVQVPPPHGEPTTSEEMGKSRVGTVLFDKIFGPYTQKQWNKPASELGPEVVGRIPVRDNFDNRYFTHRYQALPSQGFSKFFEKLLGHPNIDVRLGLDYFDIPGIQVSPSNACITYYTGPIDQFFGSSGQLEYRSLQFKPEVIRNHAGFAQPCSVVNYPSSDFPFTRIVEYKHFLYQTSPHTVLVKEYPADEGEPYYPVLTARNKELYESLHRKAKQLTNVTFVGRLANYKYIDMDQAIADALHVFDQYMNQSKSSKLQ